ncbi:hypothetical protein Pcinc_041551 [Petrolisthes cinctipes]|uniref:Protein kinase domain-containing protein n=1 Tax=Petrolisthes cinctipes TaxID=88211 RepID=A0AAE1BJZ0_PETCI|nr:hypothetical protein Pcinc_041551 [Petrolisthes cinctipes]
MSCFLNSLQEEERLSTEEKGRQLLQDESVELEDGQSVAILRTHEEIERDCENIQCLGQGVCGLVTLVRYRGMLAVKKSPNEDSVFPDYFFIGEGSVLHQLKGASGAPRLLGLAIDSPVIIMTFCEGKILQVAKPGASVLDRESWWLKVFLSITKNVMEIHALGCIHNDLHGINILLSTKGDKDSPVTHLLDFGLAQMEDWGHYDEEAQVTKVTPELDTRSLGCMFRGIALNNIKATGQDEAWEGGLKELVNVMSNINLNKIPPLSYVHQELSRLLRLSMERHQRALRMVRKKPLNTTHQPTTSTNPSLTPICTERGVRVVRHLPFPLVPPRPLCLSKMSCDNGKDYKSKFK